MNIQYIGEKRSDVNNSSIEECLDYCKNKTLLTLDIETSYKFGGKYKEQGEGLDPYLSSICMLQIGDADTQFVIDTRKISPVSLKEVLEDNNIMIIGHNIKFEYKHIKHNYGIIINNMHDTQVTEQLIYLGPKFIQVKYALKELNRRYLGVTSDKSTRNSFSTIGDRPFTYREIEYGAEDVENPHNIYPLQMEKVKKNRISACVRLENKFVAVLGDIELRGMHFDKKRWEEIYNKNLIIFKKKAKILDQYIFDTLPNSKFVERQLDLFSTEPKCKIKWTSSKQVVELFQHFNACPMEISKTTKKLAPTVNAKVVASSLNTINADKPKDLKEFIKNYISFKEYEQATTTFGIAFFKYINPVTKRLHSNYKQVMNTGRISSSAPNLQNIPSFGDDDYEYGTREQANFRGAFTCEPGFNIVNADYSGQEQIILANKSQDKDLKYFYEQNLGDMHSYIASKIFPDLYGFDLKTIEKDYPDKRQIAKGAGFAINYGGNGFTISKNLGIPKAQGEYVYNAYFEAFPGLKNYFTKTQRTALARGYILIDPITGRKNWFNRPKTTKDRGKIERAALNYPIQGEAGGITKYAPILFREWIYANSYENRVFITNIVHDEINVECEIDLSVKVAKNLERCMKEAGDVWCKDIPLKADAVITKYWTH